MKKKIISITLLAGLVTGALTTSAGATCTPYTTTIVSDTTTTVVGGVAAVAVVPDVAWTASIPGATWIWATPADAGTEVFQNGFTFPGTVTSASLEIAADNIYSVTLNGNAVGSDATPVNFTLATQDVYSPISLASFVGGTNTLEVSATNLALPAGPASAIPDIGNPGGALYKLVVHSEVCTSNISVINKNEATVTNDVSSNANTGGNTAGGSHGGNGGNGGAVSNSGGTQDVDHTDTGMGGNGGNAGLGGLVTTGDATSTLDLTNDINYSSTTIDRCGCDATTTGDILVKNRNRALVVNTAGAGADSGNNKAKGSRGGSGGGGGPVANSSGTQNVDHTTTGNGGTGGTGSTGGTVQSGNASSHISVTNWINRNITRILR